MNYRIKKNRYGFYNLNPIPPKQELEAYYAKQYYQENRSANYSHMYTDEEIIGFNEYFETKQCLIRRYFSSECSPGHKTSFLDIGWCPILSPFYFSISFSNINPFPF